MKTRNSPIIASTNNNDEAKSSPRKAPPPSLSLDDVVDADTNAATTTASSPAKRRKIDLEQKVMSDETATVSTTANHETANVEPTPSTTNVTNNNATVTAAPSSNVHNAAAVSSSNNTNSGSTSTKIETIDVATILGVKPGDRIEVKWNINEEDDADANVRVQEEGGEKKMMGLPKTEGEDEEPRPQKLDNNNNNNSSSASSPAPTGMVSVWWKATIQKATGTYHILDDEEANSSGVDSSTFGAVAAVNAYNSAKKPPSSSAAATTTTSTSAAGKDEKVYNCPKCSKHSMSKQGLYTHYGMVHGGKLSRDYPNLDFLNNTNNNNNNNANNTHQKKALPNVRVPIYEIVYDPLPQMGFPDYSTEEIAFISNVTLLNLSTEEMMNFRKEGDLASPAASSSASSPIGAVLEGGGEGGLLFADEVATTTTTTSNNPNEICKEFRTEDDIRQYMNELMQKTMLSTGLNSRMDTLPRSQQNVIATRINKALEGLLGKIMEETGRMEGGSRVVTAEVVRRCMDQMGRV
jgi:hypothetical protein